MGDVGGEAGEATLDTVELRRVCVIHLLSHRRFALQQALTYRSKEPPLLLPGMHMAEAGTRNHLMKRPKLHWFSRKSRRYSCKIVTVVTAACETSSGSTTTQLTSCTLSAAAAFLVRLRVLLIYACAFYLFVCECVAVLCVVCGCTLRCVWLRFTLCVVVLCVVYLCVCVYVCVFEYVCMCGYTSFFL